MRKLIVARARKNKRTAPMLVNARKDHSIPPAESRYQPIAPVQEKYPDNSGRPWEFACKQAGL